MMALEQDVKSLKSDYNLKYSIDSEYKEYLENQKHEEFFMISGLPRAPSDLLGKAWQDFVKDQIAQLSERLIGRKPPVVFVQNNTSRAKDAETLYQVKLERREDSMEIRSKFGYFFSAGVDSRPPDLKNVSIRNWVTHETRVRIAVLKVLGRRYKDSNPGSKVKVVTFESRPSLHLTPPPGASGRRIQHYFYPEAVSKLPTNFTSEERASIMKVVGNKFLGKLRQLFVVLTDDHRPHRHASISASADPEETPLSTPAPGRSGVKTKRGPPAPSSQPSAKNVKH
jgi:hypothetical protein